MTSPSSNPSNPPPWARPTHSHPTPHLLLRTATSTDASALTHLRSSPQNSPFGGVVNATFSVEQQLASISKQITGTQEGRNGFMVVVLKAQDQKQNEGSEEVVVEELKVHDGYLIGCSGFNSFPIEKDNDKNILIGDIGALIDHHYTRKGYALETLEKVIEVGFEELGIDVILLETEWENEPFRALMWKLGVKDLEEEGSGEGSESGRSWVYKFGREKWEVCKKELKEKGGWYL